MHRSTVRGKLGLQRAVDTEQGGLCMLLVMSLPGERLRGIRERMGLSEQEIADRSGLDAALIAQLEASGGEEMTAKQMKALSSALDVPTIYWTTQNAREYMLVRWEGLTRSRRDHLEDMGRRLEWAWDEQRRAWGQLFSVKMISARLQLQSTEDLTTLLSEPEQAKSSLYAVILLQDLGVPDPELDRSIKGYYPAIQLAATQGLSVQQLTHLIVQHISSADRTRVPLQ